MRKIQYKLIDETIENTMPVGVPFKVELVEVKEDKPTPSAIRKAMLEQFGYVHKNLLDKIVI